MLFVGSRPGQDRSVVEAARMSGGCHLFEKWVPGTITNGKMIVGHGAVVEMDNADRVNPQGPIENADPLKPDLVVCLNPLENYILLHECGLYGIPTIGIVDTDVNPTWVTYPIPANDDRLVVVPGLGLLVANDAELQLAVCTAYCRGPWTGWREWETGKNPESPDGGDVPRGG